MTKVIECQCDKVPCICDTRKKNEKIEIFFFSNGNIAAIIDGEQIPELQISFTSLYSEYLESKGYNVQNAIYNLPDRKKGFPFKTSDYYNMYIGKDRRNE